MQATLNTLIQYRDGHITPVDALEETITVVDAEVIEDGCLGWGESNAVVQYEGSHYLATVQ